MAEANHPLLTPERHTEQRHQRIWWALLGRGVLDPKAVHRSDRVTAVAWPEDDLFVYYLDGVPLIQFWPAGGTYQILYE